MKQLLFILTLIVLFFSCKKEPNDTHLMMRIRNMSGSALSWTFASGKEFGAIKNGAVTDYKEFENINAYPHANVVADTDIIYAGMLYCGTPPIPMLESGKYTLEIFRDNSVSPGYLNAKYIREE